MPVINRSLGMFAAVLTLSLAPGIAAVSGAQTTLRPLWSDDVAGAALTAPGERLITPDRFRAVTLDDAALRAALARVPLEDTPAADGRFELDLPLPDGTSGRFAVVESPIMAPELQARYPEIRTYAGRGIDDPSATVRFDLTPAGFHALILSADGSIYIDPIRRGDVRHYQSYDRSDLRSDKSLGGCTVVDEDGMAEEIAALVGSGMVLSGGQRRTYRAAVAATLEYTNFHGGTVPLGLAAIVTTMNRVNAVYEKEVSVRMVLVANNDLIVYTSASGDPYTNSSGTTMLGQNQTNLDTVIGSANYDIGHVFSTGGGGVASLGVVCRTSLKARGVTGSPAPVGDAFDIDYVAHEMGHQFGGNHPFNGTAGNCSGANRNAATAYEPGSGSTIMAYAGICPPQDLQPNSDDYFGWIGIQEILAYSTTGSGNACAVTTATGVVDPVVDAGVGSFRIPLSTPFALTGTATTTGTPTYCWEQKDVGPAGSPNAPSGNAPIFRSFPPVASPTRTFPKLGDLLGNVQTIGEILPSYGRTLSFRLTVRDVQAGGVGVANDTISFVVVPGTGPFLVTAPNTAVTWPAGTAQTVTWNTAGTTAAPINCASVNIRLSTDGGNTFPVLLAAAVPNDGAETVTLPETPTTQARVKVEAAANVFFDLSNVNFTISPPPTGAACAPDGSCVETTQAACPPGSTWQGAGTTCTPNPCPPPTHVIAASAGAGGTIAPSGAVVVIHAASQGFVITPDAGHHVVDVLVDGESVGAVPSYEFTDVTGDHTIAASFAADQFTITASAGANGSITPSGAVAVEFGASQGFLIAPDAGYHVADVLVDGSSIGAVTSHEFTAVAADHEIAASFAIDQHLLTVNVVGAGSVARSPDLPVYDHGAAVELTATPDPGYAFLGWSGDSTTTGNPLTVLMDAPHAYTATFVDSTPPVVTVLTPNGGEALVPDDHAELTWSATDNVGVAEVDLLLSRKGEAGPYEAIATGVKNSGSYDWLVDGPGTEDARLMVVARDGAGNSAADSSDASFRIADPVTVDAGSVPLLALAGVVPNPARDLAHVDFALPRAGRVHITVLDVRGRLVFTLVDGEFGAGRHRAGFSSARAPGPGLYFIRMTTAWGALVRRFAIVH